MDWKGLLRFAFKVYVAMLVVNLVTGLISRFSPTVGGLLKNPLGAVGLSA